MFPLLRSLSFALEPFLVPLCFIAAWSLIFIVVANLWSLGREGVTTVKRLHRIPCANCQFFTHNYHLKCTVHPGMALTEEAIDCTDYTPGR
uniref:Uncharacterized protein n=1 Tax=Cyanothece sp. (strain PCC 7425 / ATCC 29141) TaxID=395961 RepID=B8HSA4_CYAP4